MSHQDNLNAVEEIMKLVRDTADADYISQLILSKLQQAYSRGYDRAFNEYANYQEDMGR